MQRTRRILIAALLVVGTLLAVPATAQANDGRPNAWQKTDTDHNGIFDVPGTGVWNDFWSYGKTAHGCTYRQGWCGIFQPSDNPRWHQRPAL